MADDKEKPAAAGWFGGWFGSGGTKAVVGDELEMYYDEKLKRWIDPVRCALPCPSGPRAHDSLCLRVHHRTSRKTKTLANPRLRHRPQRRPRPPLLRQPSQMMAQRHPRSAVLPPCHSPRPDSERVVVPHSRCRQPPSHLAWSLQQQIRHADSTQRRATQQTSSHQSYPLWWSG